MATQFEVGDRVYHRRKGDPSAMEGYGRLLAVEALKGEIRWEETRKTGFVDLRDLRLVDESEESPPEW